ncbi:MAG: ankyrin repeat domain-containing protein [Gemmatimonadaceae bacterium]
MTRTLSFLAWLFIAIDLVAGVVLFVRRDGGDAATRGIGAGLGALLALLGVVAALLLWAGKSRQGPVLVFAGLALAAAPVALGAVLTFSRHGLGLIYAGLRERDVPREASPQYAYPDSATRDAALALVMNDYATLDTLLHATPAPDLAARDERGVTLLGLATRAAIMDGGSMRDLEGVRLLLAAGARPQANDLGGDGSLLELLAGAAGERPLLVLQQLLDAGLDPNTPLQEGRPILFHQRLTPEAARLLLARGADAQAPDTRGDARDWSPVTYQADLRRWATALALLEGGVPRDHGTPPGSVLARVLQTGSARTSSEERADSSYVAFIARVART